MWAMMIQASALAMDSLNLLTGSGIAPAMQGGARLITAPPFSKIMGSLRPTNMFDGSLTRTPLKFWPYIDYIGICSASVPDQHETNTELAASATSDAIGPIGRFVRRIPLRRNNVGTFMFPLFT